MIKMNGNSVKLRRHKWDADQFWQKTFKASNNEDITHVEVGKDGEGYGFCTTSSETVNQILNEIAYIVSPYQGLQSLKIIGYSDTQVLE